MTEELEEFLPEKGEEEDSYFVDKTARVMGEVEMGPNSGLFPGAIVKGEGSDVEIGEDVSIMHNSFIKGTESHGVKIEDGSFVSPGARLEGCSIGEGSLIGIDSVVLEGAEVGDDSIVGPDTIVPEDMEVPSRKVVAGKPAEIVGDVSDEDMDEIDDLRSHVKMKTKEYRMMVKRGEMYDVYDTPKRPAEIAEEHEGVSMENLSGMPDIEKMKEKLDEKLDKDLSNEELYR